MIRYLRLLLALLLAADCSDSGLLSRIGADFSNLPTE